MKSWSVVASDHACRSSPSEPLGRFVLAVASAVRTSSRPEAVVVERRRVDFDAHGRKRAAADDDLSDALAPATSFCCRTDEAMSYIRARRTMSDVSDRSMIGASAGLTLR